MKIKYINIILALLVLACIVTFPLIGCKQATESTSPITAKLQLPHQKPLLLQRQRLLQQLMQQLQLLHRQA